MLLLLSPMDHSTIGTKCEHNLWKVPYPKCIHAIQTDENYEQLNFVTIWGN